MFSLGLILSDHILQMEMKDIVAAVISHNLKDTWRKLLRFIPKWHGLIGEITKYDKASGHIGFTFLTLSVISHGKKHRQSF
ncbi:MAG TPA: hypothetical protein ENK85_10600 [Saprospiraceae bacterium]|nr:hypothetical protein [Saprospiraceae bacterium]